MIFEDNISIDKLHKELSRNIAVVENKLNKDHEIFKVIREIDDKYIIPWIVENHIPNVEPSKKLEDDIVDVMLDLNNAINKILKEN